MVLPTVGYAPLYQLTINIMPTDTYIGQSNLGNSSIEKSTLDCVKLPLKLTEQRKWAKRSFEELREMGEFGVLLQSGQFSIKIKFPDFVH